jgi:hypothetical protein
MQSVHGAKFIGHADWLPARTDAEKSIEIDFANKRQRNHHGARVNAAKLETPFRILSPVGLLVLP